MHSLFHQGPKETPVVLSYGLGVDSTSILLCWLKEPACRDFALDDLVVLTSHTGSEFPDTQRLVETHLLPLLRQFRIRYVQIARAGLLQAAGITVLDDSREPKRLFIEGDFKLAEEMLANGTVPQVAAQQRRCTAHAKGFPLTAWTDREFGDQSIRKVIGYNADERFRVQRSEGYSTDKRPIEYPLVEWAWGREQCESYVQQIVGETWRKSLCSFCCFAGGKPDILQRYRQFPGEASDALFMEFISLALNPRAPLYGGKSLRFVLEADGNIQALRLLEEQLDAVEWAVYRVRRVVWAKGRADRKTEILCRGDRRQTAAELMRQGAVPDGSHLRMVLIDRGDSYPTREEMLTACPAVVNEKARPRFDENWQKVSGEVGLFEGLE